jgi:hypothetical protein
LDVAVAGEFLDEHDVRAVMEQAGAEGVTQQMRRQLFGDTASVAQPPEQFGHVIAAQAPRLAAGGDEQRRGRVPSHGEVLIYPSQAVGGEKHRALPTAFTYDLGFTGDPVDALTVQGQCL